MSKLKVIGHRGAAGLAPENTVAAIEAGLAAGADEIEIDLRIAADGTPVLSHDAYIVNHEGKKLLIKDYDYVALRAHKPDLATLTHAVKAVGRAKPLLIEIKPGEPVDVLIAFLQAYLQGKYHPNDFAVLSFDQSCLRAVRHALPEVPLVVNESWSGVRAQLRANELGTKRINMNARWLWGGFLRTMHQRGYRIAPYTINTVRQAQRWRPYLEGVITNYPDRFRGKV